VRPRRAAGAIARPLNSGVRRLILAMDNSHRAQVDEFRSYFGDIYLRAIPRLLDESGTYLAFLSMLSAIDALAGLLAPRLGSGVRFREFVNSYFPADLRGRREDLWEMRNLMIHAFNPGKFALVCGQPHTHLAPFGAATILNGENFYEALVAASAAFFDRLPEDEEMMDAFIKRVSARDGGAPERFQVVEYDMLNT
jgi:hypothetical protein